MPPQRGAFSSAEVAGEANTMLAGLGILTMALFPLTIPGLLLFVVLPLALVAIPALPLLLPIWLLRVARRRRERAVREPEPRVREVSPMRTRPRGASVSATAPTGRGGTP